MRRRDHRGDPGGGSCGIDGRAACRRIDPVDLGSVAATDGKVAFTTGGVAGSADASYATSCDAWDSKEGMVYSSECSSNSPASWCGKTWCYVDLCNCDQPDLAGSSCFELKDESGLKLGYFYISYDAGSDAAAETYLEIFCDVIAVDGENSDCDRSLSRATPTPPGTAP